jgi:hypothetical protein
MYVLCICRWVGGYVRTVQFRSCNLRPRKWEKRKEMGGAGYEASTVPVLWHEMSMRNNNPKYICRLEISAVCNVSEKCLYADGIR